MNQHDLFIKVASCDEVSEEEMFSMAYYVGKISCKGSHYKTLLIEEYIDLVHTLPAVKGRRRTRFMKRIEQLYKETKSR